jgi:glycosyltransferase involved in cell wall biosynthesis
MGADTLSICMYTPSAAGGHARYTCDLLSALSHAGQDRDVRVSLLTSRDLEAAFRTSRYPIHDILPPLEPRSEFGSTLHWGVSRATHYLRREGTVVRWFLSNRACKNVHFQEYWPWLAPRHFRRLKGHGKRLFFTVHHVQPPMGHIPGCPEFLLRPARNRLHYAPIWDAWRLCDALFVHTEDIGERLAHRLGVGHPPIFVTPYGVSGAPVGHNTAVTAEERLRERRLLFFGANRRYKELPVLLRAMQRLPDCTLTVAGPAEDARYRGEIRDLVKRLPTGRVDLIDDRYIEGDEKARIFEQSSLVVLPYSSFVTGTSAVLHDALAYGLPVVATDVAALGESVRCWGVGQVVPPSDEAALADAIRKMLVPQRYAEASRAAARARKDRSWERVAEITIEAYHSVLGPATS